MMLFVVVVFCATSVYGGYLPPPDYGNETPTCACDEARVSSLMDRVANLESEQQRMRSDITDPKMNLRKRRQESDGVAFTAYLSHYDYHLSMGSPVIYDQTLLNEGMAYDTTSGKFTAPFDGIYMFSFIIETKHDVDTAARLVVDGANYLDAVVEPQHQEQNLQGGNVGVVKLVKGQEVWIQIYNSGDQSLEGGDTYRFTTFTGVLLQLMF